MVRGLYSAWTGMVNEQKRLDVIANNLANSATVGYKKEGVTSQSFDEQLTLKIRDASADWRKERIGSMSLGTKVGEVYTDYTQGSLRPTGNAYDLALDGEGFFAIEYVNGAGERTTQYTRAGQFTLDQEGYIVDVDGNHLLAEGGSYLQVPVDAVNVVIDINGNVIADDQYIDTIAVTDFEDYDYLKKFGETRCYPVDGAQTKEATGMIRQGYTEQSNVNVVSEMVNMITITRAYEAGQKVIQSIDSTLEQAANSIGRVQ
ncbi:MAG: flagellar hook-basal body protein [Lachnospiraceae bacterium]|nr:flagellar hook-basal body protein [Lachnospiraceae bacterium]